MDFSCALDGNRESVRIQVGRKNASSHVGSNTQFPLKFLVEIYIFVQLDFRLN